MERLEERRYRVHTLRSPSDHGGRATLSTQVGRPPPGDDASFSTDDRGPYSAWCCKVLQEAVQTTAPRRHSKRRVSCVWKSATAEPASSHPSSRSVSREGIRSDCTFGTTYYVSYVRPAQPPILRASFAKDELCLLHCFALFRRHAAAETTSSPAILRPCTCQQPCTEYKAC
ncbi:hypothetical protein PYCCODRAFT_1184484 [Trametes coccinea BRFM310]|uniref:Uncharacterized protein n=1 Tax=Trametes coccinea (strain BRFM310) TaxID=1353009 RepID=A0A1Y2I7T5_TRAC3|nr:hypothetical protein PYCCODRAFT_1184484 [Trametes coccinea BRFM310]